MDGETPSDSNVFRRVLERAAWVSHLGGSIAPDVFYRFVYPPRVLGMATAGLSAGGVLFEIGAPPWRWILLVLTSLVWPHVAYLHSRHSADPVTAERRNLMLDSIFIGLWLPMIDFNMLPSVAIAMITTLDKGYAPYRRLWLHSLIGLLLAAGLLGLLLQPAPRFASSALVVLCTLPLLFGYTWFNTYRGARLMRVVTQQNLELDQRRRIDTQTGLHARDHWREHAEEAFGTFHGGAIPACLMVIDIDHFKSINDNHGHSVGDEVISAVGRVIRASVRDCDSAGRYGGDEFVVVVASARLAEAHAIAERIRMQVEHLHIQSTPGLRLTTSIGLAAVDGRSEDLRAWIDAADAALYRAKHEGRNRICDSSGSPGRTPGPQQA